MTDEDAFVLGDRSGLLTIRVGHDEDSLAHYDVPDQKDINGLLRLLLE